MFLLPLVAPLRKGKRGPNPGKWTRGFNHDAIVSVANPAASKASGRLLLLTCLQPADFSLPALDNAVVGYQFSHVADDDGM